MTENNLHYDLDFLNIGEIWPPKKDRERLNNYQFQREQFELTPEDQIKKIIPEGLLWLGNYDDFISSNKLLGYPRLLTLKTIDMCMGQPPQITAQNDDILSEIIKEVRSESALNAVLKEALIDYSRFGVFLLRVFKDENNEPALTSWNPSEWFPVFYADGTNRIRYNVLGWQHKQELTVQIHDTQNGSYEERVLELSYDNYIQRVISAKRYNTTSKKKLLFAVVNTPTSTNPLGNNDYDIINAPLQKAIQRLIAILKVLDEHADPSMSGPHSLLSKSDNGELVFHTSKYYATGKDEIPPKYITWNGELESSFKAFDILCKQIYMLSEMGEAFLGAQGGVGNVVSGTALRFKLISPLEKARRIQNELTEPLKAITSALLFLDGYELLPKDINIAWRDSLPKDPRETAELARLESGAPAVKPLTKTLSDNYDLDKDTAESFVKEILIEQDFFKLAKNDPVNPQDGRSSSPSKVDTREKNSPMDPASSENLTEAIDGKA